MRALRVLSLVLLVVLVSGQSGFPQADDLKALRNEIDALKEEQRAIRKELQDLVNSLRERGGPATRDVRDLTIGVGRSPSRGSDTAPLTLVEFSDYQCPHCAVVQKPLRDLVRALPGKVRLCSKYFPLPGHGRAQIAAAVAEFARQKGKFWPMNDLLFAHQEELGDSELKEYARQIGLDGDAMLKQGYAGRFDPLIERQKKEGVDAGVRATPTLFFNGRHFILSPRYEFLVFSAQDEDEWQRNGGGWDKD
jgi:protein-disulfide isomerase